jgi:calcium-dependent protein kinase
LDALLLSVGDAKVAVIEIEIFSTNNHYFFFISYVIHKPVIGQGTYGVVKKCVHRKTGKEFAVKIIYKDQVPDMKLLVNEVKTLRHLHHPNIITEEDVYETPTKLYIVTELCTGGELYDHILELHADERKYSEFDAAHIIRSIVEAIAECHEHNIVHRDLKAENILLLNEQDNTVKIIDFGLATFLESKECFTESVGTVYYAAPEVMTEPVQYDEKADIWSIGVIAFILLAEGTPPFLGDSESGTIELVKNEELHFPTQDWAYVSQEAKEFCSLLLQKDPKKRPSAKEALQHAWLKQNEIFTRPANPSKSMLHPWLQDLTESASGIIISNKAAAIKRSSCFAKNNNKLLSSVFSNVLLRRHKR